ncbi:hypothetical protein ACWD7F_28205 [Streptomyces sp. NPDC005122]
MYFPGRRTFWRRHIAGPGAVVVFAGLVALLIPALSAHDGHGRQGRWTATNISCGHNGCDEIGTFLSTDGVDRRTRISMFDDPPLAIGQAAPAVDTGGAVVCPPGGATPGGTTSSE